ncbi:MAG: protein kinase [Cyanobacteria bacterium P01_B01_bin.77]
MSFSIGQRLYQNKYILEQELGRGGFGTTYKATDTVLNQTVVIKTLNDALSQELNFASYQHQFHAEAKRLAKCVHPNIVRVSDFFTDDNIPCIVMDYVPGRTLDTLVVPGRPLPEGLALHYIQQVGEAVHTVHQNGLLHRDIKPQNLILREGTQQVVLIDFGIAREFTPGKTQAHTHLVSEGYAPIEQYLPQAKRSAATDIYGLAATLYTLLTGQLPIAAPLRDRHPLPEPRQLQPSISTAANRAVMQGMAMEPQHRPAQVGVWLALLPEAGNRLVAPAASHPISQVPTAVVAPARQSAAVSQARASTVAHALPAQERRTNGRQSGRQSSGPWLPLLVLFGISLLLGLGYVWQDLFRAPSVDERPSDGSEEVDEQTPSDNMIPPNPTTIKNHIENSPVEFSSSKTKVSGKVTEASIRENAEAQNNGVRAKIEWDDNVTSTILFQKNSRVRVWEEGVEYGGNWSWSSTEILRVDMDQGAQYTFQPQ